MKKLLNMKKLLSKELVEPLCLSSGLVFAFSCIIGILIFSSQYIQFKNETITKTETVYIQEIPHQYSTYFKLSEANESMSKDFTYFDGKVQQTLSGRFKLRVYYEEKLEKPYIDVKYSVYKNQKEKKMPLDERHIESIDVYVQKEK